MSGQSFNMAARKLFLRRRMLHGSDVLALAIEHELGACADTYAEKFLRAWGVPNHPAPNHSQMAFASLGNCATKNWKVCGPGTELGWYWALRVFKRCAPVCRNKRLARIGSHAKFYLCSSSKPSLVWSVSSSASSQQSARVV